MNVLRFTKSVIENLGESKQGNFSEAEFTGPPAGKVNKRSGIHWLTRTKNFRVNRENLVASKK